MKQLNRVLIFESWVDPALRLNFQIEAVSIIETTKFLSGFCSTALGVCEHNVSQHNYYTVIVLTLREDKSILYSLLYSFLTALS